MKSLYKTLALVFSTLLLSFAINAQVRYYEPVFSDTETVRTDSIKYGESINSQGGTTELFMHIFEPSATDDVAERPMVFITHGGSFTSGSLNGATIIGVCEYLARCGYVCASVSYRLAASAAELGTEESVIRTVVRAVQDGKGAIRYMRKSAHNGNPYKIDTTRFYFGGESAGAILAYQLGYMDDVSELPANWASIVNGLGGLEGTSGNPGYSSAVNGVYGYAGAIGDTNWINQNDIPFMGMHSEDDVTVGFGYAQPLGFVPIQVYGTNPMAIRASNIGLRHQFYPYYGTGAHPPYGFPNTPVGAYDSTLTYTAKFLYAIGDFTEPTGIDNVSGTNKDVRIYPNPNNGVFTVNVPNSNQYTVSVFDLTGQLITESKHVSALEVELELGKNPKGTYIVKIKDDETGANLKTSKLFIQ